MKTAPIRHAANQAKGEAKLVTGIRRVQWLYAYTLLDHAARLIATLNAEGGDDGDGSERLPANDDEGSVPGTHVPDVG